MLLPLPHWCAGVRGSCDSALTRSMLPCPCCLSWPCFSVLFVCVGWQVHTFPLVLCDTRPVAPLTMSFRCACRAFSRRSGLSKLAHEFLPGGCVSSRRAYLTSERALGATGSSPCLPTVASLLLACVPAALDRRHGGVCVCERAGDDVEHHSICDAPRVPPAISCGTPLVERTVGCCAWCASYHTTPHPPCYWGVVAGSNHRSHQLRKWGRPPLVFVSSPMVCFRLQAVVALLCGVCVSVCVLVSVSVCSSMSCGAANRGAHDGCDCLRYCVGLGLHGRHVTFKVSNNKRPAFSTHNTAMVCTRRVQTPHTLMK